MRAIPVARLRAAGLLDALLELGRAVTDQVPEPAAPAADISCMTAADLVRMAVTAPGAVVETTWIHDHRYCSDELGKSSLEEGMIPGSGTRS
ncbi:hypothetical protein SAMN05421837_113203 [Amycolatopsis pretoriensis]|uniref:Uncharacterized protein n=1 Tax=Amycolatopsis pretoriensis TaxID=218821 RepID=A0A1H5RG64_9PSEU|nr:hypothetical protein [Amycolatopsis pretoriensis]SEF37373.1 hypothetical protein SAMN05421837_113203 [Amycolatopsis pretoriensis]